MLWIRGNDVGLRKTFVSTAMRPMKNLLICSLKGEALSNSADRAAGPVFKKSLKINYSERILFNSKETNNAVRRMPNTETWQKKIALGDAKDQVIMQKGEGRNNAYLNN